jgi:hypothetical protein
MSSKQVGKMSYPSGYAGRPVSALEVSAAASFWEVFSDQKKTVAADWVRVG